MRIYDTDTIPAIDLRHFRGIINEAKRMAELNIDLVRKAILSTCTGDFDWISPDVALRVATARENCGFTAPAIRDLVRAWVAGGGMIDGGPETRPGWRDQQEYVYWVVIQGIDEFPRGFFVEMVLSDDDPNDPMVSLVSAHPALFPERL